MGLLPSSGSFSYLLTCIHHFTQWCEAIPLSDITADTVAKALITVWISRFGIHSTITTDRGAQFKSHLWRNFIKQLGSHRLRTTAYHPMCNGII